MIACYVVADWVCRPRAHDGSRLSRYSLSCKRMHVGTFSPPRLNKFYEAVHLTPTKRRVKLEAWLCKKYAVLVKRKLQRGQLPRSTSLRLLLAAAFPAGVWGGDQDEDWARGFLNHTAHECKTLAVVVQSHLSIIVHCLFELTLLTLLTLQGPGWQ